MEEPSGERVFPWSFAFDRAANVRALGEVQRRGLTAAGQAVERLLASTANGTGTRRANGAGGPLDAELARLVELWADFARSVTALSVAGAPVAGRGVVPDDREEGNWIDVVSGRSTGTIDLVVDASGTPTPNGELWLWNRSTDPVGPMHLHAGELRSPCGKVLEPSAVCFDPAEIVELPARSSRGIGVSVRTGHLSDAGVYRAIIQVAEVPAAVMRLDVTIRSGPTDRTP